MVQDDLPTILGAVCSKIFYSAGEILIFFKPQGNLWRSTTKVIRDTAVPCIFFFWVTTWRSIKMGKGFF
jgi:hypothetical protein